MLAGMRHKAVLLLGCSLLAVVMAACDGSGSPELDIEATIEARIELAKASLIAPTAAPLPTPLVVIKEVPVEVIKEVIVEKTVEVVKEIPVETIVVQTKEVIVEKEVVKEVPVEKIVEVVVEKEVVKEVVVEKTVEVVVTATPTPTPLPTVTPMPISTVSSRPAATPTPAPNASATPTVAPVQTAGEIYQIWQGSEDTVAAIAALVSTGDYSDVEARETLNDWIRTATQESTGATDWAAIAAGAFYTVALKSDGTLWAWGENSSGQLGIGTTVPKDVPSQEVTGATNWSAISAGDFHTVALKSDGTLWAWGWNYYGQLGDGTTTRKNTPTQIGIDTNWRSISAGDSHTAALKTDNTLWTWGHNARGQLGDGTILSKSTPVQESTGENNWRSISTGDSHTAALKLDNTLWTWGYNAYGQLGDGTTLAKSIPAQESTGGGQLVRYFHWY
ncbi:hypothetical protein M1O55_03175 [Dehalococcoidia bacterium]|nr:hypothetical protein [Dehalococcoidia bacterium]